MFYLKNVNDILLLEMELQKLKNSYAAALRKQGDPSSLPYLRKLIKTVSGRINLLHQGR